jgi:hypothetical protein
LVTLRQQGDYWYGDGPTDVWEYFVWYTRNSVEPVKHWRQALCGCGRAVFEVDRDEEECYYLRRCVECRAEHRIMGDEFADVAPYVPGPGEEELEEKSEPDPEPVFCLCFGEEFEVVGVTAPFLEAPNSAKWFYLGLRCVECGCLGCYGNWIPRYLDHERFLSML